MAKIEPPSKPKQKKKLTKVTNDATDQIPPDSIKPLQLKLPESIKNEYKAFAAMQGKNMNSLFIEMFKEFKESRAC